MKTFCFDLDSTLCKGSGDYAKAKPLKKRIALVNALFDQGHTIIIDTARGSLTKKRWLKHTAKQLKDWGVKYHTLRVGVKFFADIYVDDRSVPIKAFFSNVHRNTR